MARELSELGRMIRGTEPERAPLTPRTALWGMLKEWFDPRRRQGETRAYHSIFEYGWPVVAENVGGLVLCLVDTKLTGGLGVAAIGAVVITNMVVDVALTFAQGTLSGVKFNAIFAQGEGRFADRPRYAVVGALLALVFGLSVSLFFRCTIPLIAMFGLERQLVDGVTAFAQARVLGLPGIITATALIKYRQGCGEMRSSLVLFLAPAIGALSLGYVLAYGRLGMAPLGLRGLGAGIAIAETLAGIGTVAYVATRASPTDGSRPDRPISLSRALRDVLRFGLPNGLKALVDNGSGVAMASIAASLGATALAAHEVSYMVVRPGFWIATAIAEAVAAVVGLSLASGQLKRARGSVRIGFLLALMTMGIWIAICAVGAGRLGSIFLTDPACLELMRAILLVAVPVQILSAVRVVFLGALQGAKELRFITVFGALIPWIGVAVAFLATRRLNQNIVGIQWALGIEMLLSVFLLARKVFKTPLFSR